MHWHHHHYHLQDYHCCHHFHHSLHRHHTTTTTTAKIAILPPLSMLITTTKSTSLISLSTSHTSFIIAINMISVIVTLTWNMNHLPFESKWHKKFWEGGLCESVKKNILCFYEHFFVEVNGAKYFFLLHHKEKKKSTPNKNYNWKLIWANFIIYILKNYLFWSWHIYIYIYYFLAEG